MKEGFDVGDEETVASALWGTRRTQLIQLSKIVTQSDLDLLSGLAKRLADAGELGVAKLLDGIVSGIIRAKAQL